MRRGILVLLAAALTTSPGLAQDTAPVAPAAAPASSPTAPSAAARAKLRGQLALLRLSGEDVRLPPADSFAFGGRVVGPGARLHSSIGVSGGPLVVQGQIDGDAIAIGSDIVVRSGGEITGNAVSVGGRVTLDGGRVDGEIRSLSGLRSSARDRSPASPPLTTWQAVKLVLGWFAILVVMGLGVMIFAEPNLDGVVAALESSYARSFGVGLLGQLAALPVLLVLCVALVLTLLGVLLIPFAIVAYCIAVAGLLTLGFLAASRLTGGVFARAAQGGHISPRGEHLRALFLGLGLYLGLWVLAAAFTWSPIAGAVLRGIAFAVTWVAATVGLGATLVSRAGTRRPGTRRAAERPVVSDDLSWQTPTPVAGVVAARRPQSAASMRDVP